MNVAAVFLKSSTIEAAIQAQISNGVRIALGLSLADQLVSEINTLVAQSLTMDQFVEELKKLVASVWNPSDPSIKTRYPLGRPLLLHFDELGNLGDSNVLVKFVDLPRDLRVIDDSTPLPTMMLRLQYEADLFGDFWKTLNPAIGTKHCFVYLSGKGSAMTFRGHGLRQCPGLMTHLLLELLTVEDVKKMLLLPASSGGPLLWSTLVTDGPQLLLEAATSTSCELIDGLANYLHKLTDGVPRLLSVAVSACQSLRLSSTSLLGKIADGAFDRVVLDAMRTQAPGAMDPFEALPPILHVADELVNQLALAAVTHLPFNMHDYVKLSGFSIPRMFLASELGLYASRFKVDADQASDGLNLVSLVQVTVPKVFFWSLLKYVRMAQYSDIMMTMMRLYGSLITNKGEWLEDAVATAYAVRFLNAQAMTDEERAFGAILEQFKNSPMKDILVSVNHNVPGLRDWTRKIVREKETSSPTGTCSAILFGVIR